MDIINWVRMQPTEWAEIFTNHVSDKGLPTVTQQFNQITWFLKNQQGLE